MVEVDLARGTERRFVSLRIEVYATDLHLVFTASRCDQHTEVLGIGSLSRVHGTANAHDENRGLVVETEALCAENGHRCRITRGRWSGISGWRRRGVARGRRFGIPGTYANHWRCDRC